jgi:hypothetical protein
MINKFFVFFVLFVTSSVSLACSQATPTNAPNFCATFRVAAQCHCSARLPAAMCGKMNDLYQRLLIMFGSLEKACEYQHDTTKESCMDSWNCYLYGGNNVDGKLCSGTGRACS